MSKCTICGLSTTAIDGCYGHNLNNLVQEGYVFPEDFPWGKAKWHSRTKLHWAEFYVPSQNFFV